MSKKILISIILICISVAVVFSMNKNKEYFNRIYSFTVSPDRRISHVVEFSKNKKFAYYIEQEGKNTIIYSGNYYYDKKEKKIHIEYLKDNEKWNRTLSWNKIDSNKELLFPIKTDDSEYTIVLYMMEE